MTDGGNAAPQPPQQPFPSLSVLGQYVKDFSFENPNAPASLRGEGQPTMQIGINLGVAQQAESDYEVTLKLEGKAERTGSVLFAFELSFAGLLRVQNVPPEHLQAVLMIEGPRLLFPFAREIVATAVRNGGFAPLLLDPVDFSRSISSAWQPRRAPSRWRRPWPERRSGFGARFKHLAALVHPGLEVDVMRPAKLPGILVLHIGGPLEGVG